MVNFDLFNNSEDADSGLEISDLMTTLVSVFILSYAVIKQGDWDAEQDRRYGMDIIIEQGFPAIKQSKHIAHSEGGIVNARGFFEHSSTNLSESEKELLEPICSNIIEVVSKHSNSIKYVIFKGHASSSSSDEHKYRQYFLNQGYSEERARNTMEYCVGSDFDQKHPDLLGKFMSIGYSYSQSLENPNASSARRVEIEFVPYD